MATQELAEHLVISIITSAASSFHCESAELSGLARVAAHGHDAFVGIWKQRQTSVVD
jgi:hypothetical protein